MLLWAAFTKAYLMLCKVLCWYAVQTSWLRLLLLFLLLVSHPKSMPLLLCLRLHLHVLPLFSVAAALTCAAAGSTRTHAS